MDQSTTIFGYLTPQCYPPFRKKNSCVLVHCKMGVSRSASTVLAYAMKSENWSLAEALTYVVKRRPIVKPNEGFRSQLVVYEGILRAKCGPLCLFVICCIPRDQKTQKTADGIPEIGANDFRASKPSTR
jgi:hypothetical protein